MSLLAPLAPTAVSTVLLAVGSAPCSPDFPPPQVAGGMPGVGGPEGPRFQPAVAGSRGVWPAGAPEDRQFISVHTKSRYGPGGTA